MKRYTIPLLACVFVLILGAGRGDEPDIDDLTREADRLARDKKYDEALVAIHKAIKKDPTDDRLLMIASEINRRAGHFAEGKRDALAAIKINDRVGLYYALVAANAYHNEEPELALEYCRKVIDMGAKKAGESIYKDAKLYEDLLLKKTYTLTWKLDPSDPKHRKFNDTYLRVALPKDGLPYQSVEVQVKDAKSHRIIKGEANDVVNVVPNGEESFQVITKVTMTPVSYKAKLAKAVENGSKGLLPANVRTYLGAAETIEPSSPALKKIAAEVKGGNSIETVRNILAWLKKNITYKEGSSDITKLNFKKVDEIIERGHAECRGYTMLFAALCRAAGVPARPVWGLLFANKTYKSHNWDEVYITGVGWVPVDPQAAETFGWLPINRVRMFMDLRRSAKSEENLPVLNLLFMNGPKIQFEQSR
ncbi:MAG TPA: transglutaminase domain-containing protein [Gemmataceae bacterium]|nr:transglutaminase domain-containing protein [Gemmataceae bacterium]